MKTKQLNVKTIHLISSCFTSFQQMHAQEIYDNGLSFCYHLHGYQFMHYAQGTLFHYPFSIPMQST